MRLGFGLGLQYSKLSGGGSGNTDAFIIEVKTDNAGTSNDNQFQFTGALGDYDVVAKQNDIVVATFDDLSGAETITLPSSGVYVLEVIQKEVNGFNIIKFDNKGDNYKILDTKNWGNIVWASFENAFYGCNDMTVTATDVPNLSNVTDMSGMFFLATSANPDTSNWDVSSVTAMSYMFREAASANPDTSNWDVSSVNDMRFMFRNATSANPDTLNWDVSSVTNMRYMFSYTSSANPDTTNWNVSNVTDMYAMFLDASIANPDTSNWDVSSVTTMSYMFQGASSANPNTTNWDVSNITEMKVMFYNATSANPDTSNWDVSNVTDMYAMFLDATSANPDTSNWDVSSVTDMSEMLENSNLSEENLTLIYENWSQLNLQQNVEFSAGSTNYNPSGQAGRDILVNTYNWIIIDGGFEGILNQFPGASLGLSLDKLDKNYTGSAIKVRRSSDNNELDIGFVNNELDTASLLDFVGSGDAFVSIIYDQVGSNNMTQTTANLQGQIVSNGSVILKGGKPCIIRSANDDGGYISTYAPNDGATVKGVFYVGDNESKTSIILGSATNTGDFSLVAEKNSINSQISDSVIVSNTKLNGISTTFSNRNDVYIKTNLHFLLYREIEFNFEDNVLGLGYNQDRPVDFGMFTFQELVIFENTDDAVAKENNRNAIYNIY